ncbi:MAG TPA: hypothetical protein VK601_21170, partial [Kofleriaceae bacterium]|nr:hypothetical protein [Kofleriaceae bacterium]
GKPVNAAAVAEHRVAPGTLVVVASAPDIERWTQQFSATQGARVVVEIDVAQAGSALRQRRRGRVAGLSLVAAGATVLAVAAVYGGSAYLDWRSANASCGGNTEHCPSAGYPFAQTELASARRSATIASWSTAVGLATTALGLLIDWSFRNPNSAETGAQWRASPVVGSQTVGVALTRSLP